MNALRRPLGLAASLVAFAMGCGDSAPSAADAAATDASADTVLADAATDASADTVLADAATDTASDAATDTATTGGGLRFLAQLNAGMGQLAEGIAVRDNAIYVGLAPTGQILRIDASGNATPFAQVPIPSSTNPAAPNGYLLGLAFDRAGNLYAAAPSFGMAFQPGIYRVAATGGTATLFARDTMGRMNFPNSIDFDAVGNLYVTDSASGSVFRVSPDGMTVTQWVTSPLLTGVMGPNPCSVGAGFPLGANGIAYDAAGMSVYVSNTDRATVVRIPVAADGAAGVPTVLAPQNCAVLAGADGLARGPDGALYIASNVANVIARVSLDGSSVTALERGGILDSPASIAFGSLGGSPSMYITNAAFTSAQTPGATPRPGVLVRTAP